MWASEHARAAKEKGFLSLRYFLHQAFFCWKWSERNVVCECVFFFLNVPLSRHHCAHEHFTIVGERAICTSCIKLWTIVNHFISIWMILMGWLVAIFTIFTMTKTKTTTNHRPKFIWVHQSVHNELSYISLSAALSHRDALIISIALHDYYFVATMTDWNGRECTRVRFFVLKIAAADFYLKRKISNFAQLSRADLIVNSDFSLMKNRLQLEMLEWHKSMQIKSNEYMQ